MFCKHEWEVKDKTEFESPLKNAGYVPKGDVPSWAFNRMVVVILACKKCGKIYKSREDFTP